MHLHLDCFAGLAGDMLLGALIELGTSRESLVTELEKLRLDGWSVAFPRRDAGHGVMGLGVEVSSDELSSARRGNAAEGRTAGGSHGHSHDHDHDHPHDHDPAHSPEHSHEPDLLNDTQEHEAIVVRDLEMPVDQHATLEWQEVAVEAALHDSPPASAHTHAHAHRSYAEIAALIAEAGLAPRAERRAQAVFRRLAEAEARVHGTTVEAVHFHEVGAIDSIVDIVGVAVALDLLDVDTISSAPVPLGRGFTRSQHGHIPIPAPATMECLRGVPCFDSGLDSELVTPTGAAVLGSLVESFARFPEMTIVEVGFGAGTRRLPDRPNVLRAVLGVRAASAPLERDEVWELAVNLDDQAGESLAPALDALWKAGAVDVWTTPIVMKKGRAALQVAALVPPQARDAALEALLRHTTSLGVRLTRHERAKLVREQVSVETRYGAVRIKVGRGFDGSVWNLAPEADDCVARAEAADVPVKLVYQAAVAVAVGELL